MINYSNFIEIMLFERVESAVRFSQGHNTDVGIDTEKQTEYFFINKFKVMHINVQSLLKKIYNLEFLLYEEKPQTYYLFLNIGIILKFWNQ